MIVYVKFASVKKSRIVTIQKVTVINRMVVIKHHPQVIDHVMRMEIMRDINHDRIMMMIGEIEDV